MHDTLAVWVTASILYEATVRSVPDSQGQLDYTIRCSSRQGVVTENSIILSIRLPPSLTGCVVLRQKATSDQKCESTFQWRNPEHPQVRGHLQRRRLIRLSLALNQMQLLVDLDAHRRLAGGGLDPLRVVGQRGQQAIRQL